MEWIFPSHNGKYPIDEAKGLIGRKRSITEFEMRRRSGKKVFPDYRRRRIDEEGGYEEEATFCLSTSNLCGMGIGRWCPNPCCSMWTGGRRMRRISAFLDPATIPFPTLI